MAKKSHKSVSVIGDSDRFQPVAGLVFRTVDGGQGEELMIIPPSRRLAEESSALLTLQGSGKLIWDLLDGKHSVRQIVNHLVAAYQVEEAEAAHDLQLFLEDLLARGLIEK